MNGKQIFHSRNISIIGQTRRVTNTIHILKIIKSDFIYNEFEHQIHNVEIYGILL